MTRPRTNPLVRLWRRLVGALDSLARWDEPEPWDVADWGFDQPERR
ncbi:hypothetical protein ITP53_11415 [Nonomuraea sp. K274]|uniref:Uncharacterized protein n=1 Tax=Nonomuraea cypriaca TaxID=1187855 RepID=A0A931ABL7_9ACTN|nr:hypothetical protein [Nonomuraea cypriaca]MBF8186347.1 hypothetical protein [Nonomuraea cypriaca]